MVDIVDFLFSCFYAISMVPCEGSLIWSKRVTIEFLVCCIKLKTVSKNVIFFLVLLGKFKEKGGKRV